MAKIDLEKVLIALLDSPFNKQFDDKVKDALKEQGLEYKDGEIVESQKPKFHEGDWVINRTDNTIMQIINNTDVYESIEIGGQRRTDTYNNVEWNFRLWSIEDAKDGDVLACGDEVTDCPFIFHNLTEKLNPRSYCGVNTLCDFQENDENGGSWCDSEEVRPATKEQRDLLFQKMKEAGYEWNAEMKELKKIEPIDEYERGKASFANRQLYNRAILAILSNYVDKYPDIRFGQMLFNLDIKPHFDEESRETYWNLNETINKKS